MTIDEICYAASRGEPIPKYANLYESMLYSSLRNTYDLFRNGKLTLEQATAEKNHLLYQFDLHKRSVDNHLSSARRYQEVTIATEAARTEFRKLLKAKAPEKEIISCACRLVGILDGIMPIYENQKEE